MAVHYVHSGVVETVENWKACALCKCVAATRLPLIVLGEYGDQSSRIVQLLTRNSIFFPPQVFYLNSS